jgi:hypothetical protein
LKLGAVVTCVERADRAIAVAGSLDKVFNLKGNVVIAVDGVVLTQKDFEKSPYKSVFNGAFVGFGPAVNLGMAEMKDTDACIISHDDVSIPKSFGANKVLDRIGHLGVDWGIIGFKSIHPFGFVTQTYRTPLLFGNVFEIVDLYKGYYPEHRRTQGFLKVRFLGSGFWMVNTKVFNEVKGFSPKFVPFVNDDLDICFKMLESEHAVLYYGDDYVVHATYTTIGGGMFPDQRIREIVMTNGTAIRELYSNSQYFRPYDHLKLHEIVMESVEE